jgi:hypothetical protein
MMADNCAVRYAQKHFEMSRELAMEQGRVDMQNEKLHACTNLLLHAKHHFHSQLYISSVPLPYIAPPPNWILKSLSEKFVATL